STGSAASAVFVCTACHCPPLRSSPTRRLFRSRPDVARPRLGRGHRRRRPAWPVPPVAAQGHLRRRAGQAHRVWGGLRVLLLPGGDRKSTRLNSSHVSISYAVFCSKKKTHPKRI